MRPDDAKVPAREQDFLDGRRLLAALTLTSVFAPLALGLAYLVARNSHANWKFAAAYATAAAGAGASSVRRSATEVALGILALERMAAASHAVDAAEAAADSSARNAINTSPPPGMVHVTGGTFTMGSPHDELGRFDNESQKSVTVAPFYISPTEVTQGEWKALSGGQNPSYFQTPTCTYTQLRFAPPRKGDCLSVENANDNAPVEGVDWYSAVPFANAMSKETKRELCYELDGCEDSENGWKDGKHSGCKRATFVGPQCTGYRLATEAEWEFAARAGTTTATYGGNLTARGCSDQTLLDLAWCCRNSQNADMRTHAVAGKQPNSFGLYDMLGNVHEWTSDSYRAKSSFRVTRGGSEDRVLPSCRAAARDGKLPDSRFLDLGFRLLAGQPEPSSRQ